MTSREWLAVAVPAVPALAAAGRRRRSSSRDRRDRALGRAECRGSSHSSSPAVAITAADDPISGRLARRRCDRRRLRRRDRRRRARERALVAGVPQTLPQRARPAGTWAAPRTTATSSRLLGRARRGATRREPRHRLAADRGHDGRVGAPRRIQRSSFGSRGRLEVPRAHDARARVRAARDRAHRSQCARVGSVGSLGARSPRSTTGIRPALSRVRAPPCRPGSEDRLGAGAQLASRRALRGAAARLGSPLERAPPGRARRCMALRRRRSRRPSARDWRTASSSASGSSRSQSQFPSSGARSPGSVSSPTRAWSTWACSPSASRSPTRSPWPASSCTWPATRSPRLSASMQPHRCSGTSRPPAGRAATGVGRTSPALGASMGISLGTLAGPAAVAALRERGAHRGGRLRRRTDVGGGRRSGASRTRLPRACARTPRDDRREGTPPRSGIAARAAHGRRAHGASQRLPCSRSPSSLPGCPAPSSSRPCWERRDGVPRTHLAEALESGWSFAGLYAVATGGPVRVVLANDERRASHRDCRVHVAGAVPSIVDLVPAANWDEREAHDLYGVRFDGHEPLRPLVDHDLDVARWTVPVQGRDAYQVAVGPIHAGVIESGHFRFHLVGEKILHLDARLFYKHRGLERAAEGSQPRRRPPVRRAGMRGLRGHERRRVRARDRGSDRPTSLPPSSPARARSCSSWSGSGAT